MAFSTTWALCWTAFSAACLAWSINVPAALAVPSAAADACCLVASTSLLAELAKFSASCLVALNASCVFLACSSAKLCAVWTFSLARSWASFFFLSKRPSALLPRLFKEAVNPLNITQPFVAMLVTFSAGSLTLVESIEGGAGCLTSGTDDLTLLLLRGLLGFQGDDEKKKSTTEPGLLDCGTSEPLLTCPLRRVE
uniref:(northern house mosquito) hypothetical protein n=1 Tax=Culex pipiens TaxID=7175 RepID=A0A8D8FDP8_CULPI